MVGPFAPSCNMNPSYHLGGAYKTWTLGSFEGFTSSAFAKNLNHKENKKVE